MTADPAAVARWADAIMVAIEADQAAGLVPAAVASFSELHDYRDGNMYVIDVLAGAFPVPAEHYGDEYPDGSALGEADQSAADAETEAANAVMAEVDRRLKARAAAAGGDDLDAIRSTAAGLGSWLAIWSARREPDAFARRAASDAVGGIDVALAALYRVRARLITETRRADDEAAARADARLARRPLT